MARSTRSGALIDGSGRLANTFAALAVTINDRLLVGLAERYELGPSDTAALVVLGRVPQRIEDVRQQLGLSHSAAVRLVDRLEASGLAVRGRGGDARSVRVRLTAAGRRRAHDVLTERERIVADMLAGLSPSERRSLAEVVERLLEQLATDWQTTMLTCRLCNIPLCEAHAPCPAALGAQENDPRPIASAPSGQHSAA